MKEFSKLTALFLMIGVISACSHSGTKPLRESDYIKSEVQDSAELMTFQVSDNISPDPVLALKIKQMLVFARNYTSDIHNIAYRSPWNPKQLIIGLSDDAPPLQIENPRKTGHEGIDELNKKYHASEIENTFRTNYTFNYDRPLNIPVIAAECQKLDGIIYAEPNRVIGGGDNISIERFEDRWQLVFVRGWGDCPAGCIYKHYWEFKFSSCFNMHFFHVCF